MCVCGHYSITIVAIFCTLSYRYRQQMIQRRVFLLAASHDALQVIRRVALGVEMHGLARTGAGDARPLPCG
jgi:hypothetical protein